MTEIIIISAAVIAVSAWCAAAKIRAQKRDLEILAYSLAYAVGGDSGPLQRTRANDSAWYDRPLPLAVLAAALRPARTVRALRSHDDAISWTLDAMLAQRRKHHPTGPQPVLTTAA